MIFYQTCELRAIFLIRIYTCSETTVIHVFLENKKNDLKGYTQGEGTKMVFEQFFRMYGTKFFVGHFSLTLVVAKFIKGLVTDPIT